MDQMEQQIAQVLARHVAPGAALGDLDGIGKFLKKAAKKIGGVVKKVIPAAATVVGGVFGGPAGAALGAAAGGLGKKSKKARKAAEQARAQGLSPAEAMTRVAGSYMQDYGMSPQMVQDPQMQQILRAAAVQELPEVAVTAQPTWVVPAAIGGGVLLLALLNRKQGIS